MNPNMLSALKGYVHIPCCDHVLNTILTHLFDMKNLDRIPKVKSLLTASKELVRYFKKAGLMRYLPTTLKQEVCTRWNTMHGLLESVLNNYDAVENILQTRGELYRYTLCNVLAF
jgi:hypothetical protein